MTPPLIAVAHGSRDPRSAATVARLVEEVRRQRPDLDARLCFLDLSAPRLPDVLAGERRAVVVPLLLGRAYHARVDVPGEVARAVRRAPGLDVAIADVLGSDVEHAALDRLAEAVGPLDDPGLGVVLAGVGSSDAAANARVSDVVAGWRARFGWHGAAAAFATAEPSVGAAIARLRAEGAHRVAVAQWVLAPGLLPDRIERAAAAADVPVAAALGAHPEVAALVVHRYEQSAAHRTRHAAAAS